MTAELTVRLVGGPTAVVELGGVRLLTDPTFDPPGDHPIGTRVLTKTTGPAVPADELGPVDAVLLSHDQHPDNLDRSGRALLAGVPLVLTTEQAAQRLGGTARALPSWERAAVSAPVAAPSRSSSAIPRRRSAATRRSRSHRGRGRAAGRPGRGPRTRRPGRRRPG